MMITFRSNRSDRTTVDVSLAKAVAVAGLALVGTTAVALWGGFVLGERYGQGADVDAATAELRSLLDSERQVIAEVKAEQRDHLDALALKIAELQTHLIRLDALGDRLVEVGELDEEEFDFSAPPPTGGIDDALPADAQSARDLTADMRRIASLLADREQKLEAVELLLMNRNLLAEAMPSGKPVKKGWMSSGFGKRTDPFRGSKSFHRGLDFAGKRGSEVVAVASGIVTRAKKVAGYGNVVEIKHADGYSTLYGHNKENLVKEGEMVSKGQTIALLGSTGRSSGPHVHFEVHHNGKIVDPLRYVRAR
jgi:multidrug efflux pump subunit AcrA (membrane-fusion protein)